MNNQINFKIDCDFSLIKKIFVTIKQYTIPNNIIEKDIDNLVFDLKNNIVTATLTDKEFLSLNKDLDIYTQLKILTINEEIFSTEEYLFEVNDLIRKNLIFNAFLYIQNKNSAKGQTIVSNIDDGIANCSIESIEAKSGAKVFSFILNYEYSKEDINHQRYYINNVTNELIGKPFSIVLGENYDFVGTIIECNIEKSYIVVDNYIEPNAKKADGTPDSSKQIHSDSYILIPYNEVDLKNSPYFKDGTLVVDMDNPAQMLGEEIIGQGATSLGYKCYAQSDGAFAAGMGNIASGKYSGTLGRHNAMGYCDFGFGQNLKFFGHWNGGFGRDIFIDRLGDFTITGGRLHEIYGSYTSAFGMGHNMNLSGSNARGLYSAPDPSRKIVDRVGWGTAEKPQNIYTLDYNGNAWFKGDISLGGFEGRVSGAMNIDHPAQMLSLKGAKMGDMAIVDSVVYDIKLGENGEANGLSLYEVPTNKPQDAYSFVTRIGGKSCRKSGYMKEDIEDVVAESNRWQKMLYFNVSHYEIDDTPRTVDIEISYYDIGSGSIAVEHTSTKTVARIVNISNTKKWKKAIVSIKDMKFQRGFNGYDFRLYCSTGSPMYISNVAVHIQEMDADLDSQYVTKEVYTLASHKLNAYEDFSNWIKISKEE